MVLRLPNSGTGTDPNLCDLRVIKKGFIKAAAPVEGAAAPKMPVPSHVSVEELQSREAKEVGARGLPAASARTLLWGQC